MNVSCNGLILLLRGRVGHVGGAREMKNGGADKLHFPPEWLLLWVSRTPVGTSSLTQWVLSVRALPVLLVYLA